MMHVQGDKVYSYRNNSAADCSIAFKFGTEFDRGEGGLLYLFEDRGQRSEVKFTGSKFKGNSVT